jgi:hypothetical protein
MMDSERYAHVNINGVEESVLVRIKKDVPMPESDKDKLTAWANQNGFIVSKRKHILRAE